MISTSAFGYIITDIPLKKSNNGEKTYTQFILSSHGKDDPTVVRCVAFGKTAECLNQYFKPGSRIHLVGELKNDNYKSKPSADDKMEILVRHFDFIDSLKDSQPLEEVTNS